MSDPILHPAQQYGLLTLPCGVCSPRACRALNCIVVRAEVGRCQGLVGYYDGLRVFRVWGFRFRMGTTPRSPQSMNPKPDKLVEPMRTKTSARTPKLMSVMFFLRTTPAASPKGGMSPGMSGVNSLTLKAGLGFGVSGLG